MRKGRGERVPDRHQTLWTLYGQRVWSLVASRGWNTTKRCSGDCCDGIRAVFRRCFVGKSGCLGSTKIPKPGALVNARLFRSRRVRPMPISGSRDSQAWGSSASSTRSSSWNVQGYKKRTPLLSVSFVAENWSECTAASSSQRKRSQDLSAFNRE